MNNVCEYFFKSYPVYSDGTIDTDSLINDWSNVGAEVYTYTGSSAQNAFNAIQNGTWNPGTDYGSNNAYGYNVSDIDGDFDVIQFGGEQVNDPFGTMSFWGGGAVQYDEDGNKYADHMDRPKTNQQFMKQDHC